MNLFGSYRALRNNSKAAMLAAIEIYNKPQMSYRDECFIILLVNAWELLLKAMISKSRQSIYSPKERGLPYKTLSLGKCIDKSRKLFPVNIPFQPVIENLNLLIEYRNRATHFYNQEGFSIIIYGLAQTSIVNYRDLMLSIFKVDISNEINISLLPLSFGIQPDPIQFLHDYKSNPSKSKHVSEFVANISKVTSDLETNHLDTSRFLTVYKVNFQSVKKIGAADVVIGVQGLPNPDSPVVVEKRVNPNESHKETQSSIIKRIGDNLNGIRFTVYVFQAIVWQHDIKAKEHLCWIADNGVLIKYSSELVGFIGSLSQEDIQGCIDNYKKFRRMTRKYKKR